MNGKNIEVVIRRDGKEYRLKDFAVSKKFRKIDQTLDMLEAYIDGSTLAEVGENHGVSANAVRHRICRFQSYKGARERSTRTGKLTADEVEKIREKYEPYKYTLKELGEEYGVSYSTIRNVVTKQTYTQV